MTKGQYSDGGRARRKSDYDAATLPRVKLEKCKSTASPRSSHLDVVPGGNKALAKDEGFSG